MRLKILFIFLTFPVLIFSQSPEKFSYQSVIKNSRGYLLKNQEVGLRISILFNSANGASVYSEEHTALSNDNGLITLTIGEGTTSDVFSSIDWGNGEYYLKVEVDPEGGINYVMNQTSQLLSVPYALYAGNATVNLSVIGQSYLTVSGSQITANKIDASTDVEGLSTVAVSGDYASLTNLPTLFDGDYANLTNKPTLFDGDYANLTNKPELEDGKLYIGDSDNKSAQIAVTGDVTISNTGVTAIGAQKVTNSMIADDAVGLDELANITDGSILIGGASNAPTEVVVTGDVTISNTGVTAIGAQKVTNSMIADDAVGLDELANITQGSLLTGDSSNNPLLLDAKGTGKIIVGNGTALASVSIGGVINLASNGDVSIVDDAISYDKIQNIATANRVLGSTAADGVISEVQVATDMIADNAVNLTTKVAGTLPIANGGTGGATANAALNSLGLYFGTATFNGTSVTIDSVSGLKSSSKIFLTFSANDGNDIYVSNINTTDSEFTLTVSGGFSSTATVNWLVIIN